MCPPSSCVEILYPPRVPVCQRSLSLSMPCGSCSPSALGSPSRSGARVTQESGGLSIEWLAGVLFLVALVVGVAAPVAAIAGLDPINALDTPAVAWTGVAIGAVGVLLTLAAQLSMGDSWRIGVDDRERTALGA